MFLKGKNHDVKNPLRHSDKIHMNIRGIGPINNLQGGIIDAKERSVNASDQDRDARQEQHERQKKQVKLTPEQIKEAFQALVDSLNGTGLRAVSEIENKLPVFKVFDKDNQEIRQLRYPRIVELYIERNNEVAHRSGTLLKKSA